MADTHCAVRVPIGEIVMPQLLVVTVGLCESATLTVNEYGPAVEGVPLIKPVVAFSVSPGGSEPELSEKVNGATPPLTAIDDE